MAPVWRCGLCGLHSASMRMLKSDDKLTICRGKKKSGATCTTRIQGAFVCWTVRRRPHVVGTLLQQRVAVAEQCHDCVQVFPFDFGPVKERQVALLPRFVLQCQVAVCRLDVEQFLQIQQLQHSRLQLWVSTFSIECPHSVQAAWHHSCVNFFLQDSICISVSKRMQHAFLTSTCAKTPGHNTLSFHKHSNSGARHKRRRGTCKYKLSAVYSSCILPLHPGCGQRSPISALSPSTCTSHTTLRVRCAHVSSEHLSQPSW